MDTKKLQPIVINALEDLKAENIVALDVHALTSICDVMIICTARSSRNLHALADNVIKQAKANHHPPLGTDGKDSDEWMLVDLGNIVVHIMTATTRDLYKLEELWTKREN